MAYRADHWCPDDDARAGYGPRADDTRRLYDIRDQHGPKAAYVDAARLNLAQPAMRFPPPPLSPAPGPASLQELLRPNGAWTNETFKTFHGPMLQPHQPSFVQSWSLPNLHGIAGEVVEWAKYESGQIQLPNADNFRCLGMVARAIKTLGLADLPAPPLGSNRQHPRSNNTRRQQGPPGPVAAVADPMQAFLDIATQLQLQYSELKAAVMGNVASTPLDAAAAAAAGGAGAAAAAAAGGGKANVRRGKKARHAHPPGTGGELVAGATAAPEKEGAAARAQVAPTGVLIPRAVTDLLPGSLCDDLRAMLTGYKVADTELQQAVARVLEDWYDGECEASAKHYSKMLDALAPINPDGKKSRSLRTAVEQAAQVVVRAILEEDGTA
jgi:hypothetical protein